MIKKTISYLDFDGNQQTEDVYFHFTKAELIELETSEADGLSKKLERISKSENMHDILKEFRGFLTQSVGQRSEDGRRFTKTQEYRDWFTSSEAYSELLFELLNDANKAAAFVNGLFPPDLVRQIAERQANQPHQQNVFDQPAPATPVNGIPVVGSTRPPHQG